MAGQKERFVVVFLALTVISGKAIAASGTWGDPHVIDEHHIIESPPLNEISVTVSDPPIPYGESHWVEFENGVRQRMRKSCSDVMMAIVGCPPGAGSPDQYTTDSNWYNMESGTYGNQGGQLGTFNPNGGDPTQSGGDESGGGQDCGIDDTTPQFGKEGSCSPLLVDLGRNGISLGEAGVGVYFDADADGEDEFIQWVRAYGDEVFLARDLNGNGVIDDGAELFGVGTSMELFGGIPARHGFEALAQFDEVALGGNKDGRVTDLDEVWAQLLLWNDLNADGESGQDELVSVSDSSVTRLAIKPKLRPRYVDEAGNRLLLWAKAKLERGRAWMVDVFFKPVEQ